MPASDRSSTLRSFFATYVTRRAQAKDPRIAAAFASVPREDYIGPGPWTISVPRGGKITTPDADVAFLYQDTLVAIDVARSINIGEPSLHARCLDAIGIREGETVLHVGAGVGYYTAILASLVGEGGRIHAFEIEADLAERAARNLVRFPWVDVQARSGFADDLSEADVIYVNAGLPQIPHIWLDALRVHGRLIFPFQPTNGFGGMLLIERPESRDCWPARIVTPAGFIGCQGGEDTTAGERLSKAIRGGGWQAVRSLRRDDAHDGTCWLAGDGWWLSTAEPDRPG